MNQLAGIGKTYRAKLSRVLERHSGVITPAFVSEELSIAAIPAIRPATLGFRNMTAPQLMTADGIAKSVSVIGRDFYL